MKCCEELLNALLAKFAIATFLVDVFIVIEHTTNETVVGFIELMLE